MNIEKLRPHHLLDIITSYKPEDLNGEIPKVAPGENGVPIITRALASNLDSMVKFVVGPDDICVPCSHLKPDGKCDRVLQKHNPPQPIDEYNDPLDTAILKFLGMKPGQTMQLRKFLELLNAKTPGIEKVCTHPGQKTDDRLNGIIQGLTILGIRKTK